jgi:predicted AlkP superfamily phosphohydrolase/phosphomutase
MSDMQKNRRTLVVGLDAACWAFYQPLLDAGRLPVLARLMASGASGQLDSTMPAWTPAAWATISSGKNPGKHGVFDMMWLRPKSYEFSPTNATKRLGTAFWSRLSDAGVRVGLMNVPFCHPPDPVEGFVVSGFGAPGGVPDITHPASLLDDIQAKHGAYEPWLRFRKFGIDNNRERIKADRLHQQNQVEICADAMEKHPVDVLVINLMLPDHANHWLADMDELEETICQTDADLGRLIEIFSPDNVMAFSDHGSRRVEGDFLLHLWLRDHGYSVQRPRTSPERREVLNMYLAGRLKRRLGSGTFERALRRIGLMLIPRLPDALRTRFWDGLEKTMPLARINYELSDELDYSRSKVYLGSSRSGLLFLNRVGREPGGIVSEAERGPLLDELVSQLQALRDASGRPLFSAVHRSESIYSGPMQTFAPDITIDFYDSPWNLLATFRRGTVEETLSDRYFVPNDGEYGHHSRDGLYVFSGPDFQQGHQPTYNLVDLPATLLHLYDVPVPDDFDGELMAQTLSPDLQRRSRRTQAGDAPESVSPDRLYSADQEAELVERMVALGYLD